MNIDIYRTDVWTGSPDGTIRTTENTEDIFERTFGRGTTLTHGQSGDKRQRTFGHFVGTEFTDILYIEHALDVGQV